MTLLMNTELRGLLLTHPAHQVQTFVQQYERDKRSTLPVALANTQPIRETFASERGSGISASILRHEDAHEGFLHLLPNAVLNERESQVLGRNEGQLHSLAFQTTITRKYTETEAYRRNLATDGHSELNAEMEAPAANEPTFYVELELNDRYLQFRAALEHSLVDEHAQGANGNYSGCSLPLKSIKTEFTAGFPTHLPIHIKRFNANLTKNNLKLHIPAEVVLKQNDQYAKYDLKAFVEHQGFSLDGGHYVTYVNEGTHDAPDWICYNDSRATQFTPEEALLHVENAYMPYFEKRDVVVDEVEFQRVNAVNEVVFRTWQGRQAQARHAQQPPLKPMSFASGNPYYYGASSVTASKPWYETVWKGIFG